MQFSIILITILGSSLFAAAADLDYINYRHVVARGVQKALDECREKFKWDRWNCPKKAFLDLLQQEVLPSNKELGLTRALMAAGIVTSLTQSCTEGSTKLCGCNVKTSRLDSSEFNWRGCDDSVHYAFLISKRYLERQDEVHDAASQLVNAHNFEVGRQAVKMLMKRHCKCHGASGSCAMRTCWTELPDMATVTHYIKRQYRVAAKVGSSTTRATNITELNKELAAIDSTKKLAFIEPSPDYCYEDEKLGINGTLGRYCSRKKHPADGEKDSCDRLCTKCGYKIEKKRVVKENQCDCRFLFCCKIECKLCPPHVEDTYRCVRHS